MHWASRIALIAYVVGGWFLPAIHHHSDPLHTGMHNGLASHHHQSHCCSSDCNTDACDADDSDDLENVALPPGGTADLEVSLCSNDFNHSLIEGDSCESCIGLCALCVAQSLTSESICGRSINFEDKIPSNDIIGDALSLSLGRELGGISSRGPPSAA